MNYIYDLVLNFFELNNNYEFYEWDKNDKFVYIEKIPIYKVNSVQMNEIINNKIKINNKVLNSIYNETCIDIGKIPYCFLITDSLKVIALKFDNNGILTHRSNLLLDEEDAVIDEVNAYKLDLFEYSIIEKVSNNCFLTRKEKYIQKYLIDEINKLYLNKDYDELDYLYKELFSNNCTIIKKYHLLIDYIKNNYDYRCNTLYEIIKLAKKEILSN